MKRTLAWLLTVIALCIFSLSAIAEQTMTIGISEMGAHPFFASITDGIKSVLEPLGYTFVVKASDYNVTPQIADVEDMVAQKVDAIFFSPYDSVACRPALEAAAAAGIPVFIVDNPAYDKELVVCSVATDNYDAGVQNALQCIKDLNGEGKIVVLDGPQAESSLQRGLGFTDTIKEQAPGIEIVAQQDYESDQAKAMSIMENILQAQPEIDAVFTTNENGAYGVVAALEAAQRLEGTYIYSVDGSNDAVAMIKEGKITGTAAQQTQVIGQTAAEMFLRWLEGDKETIEKNIAVPVLYVTKENAEGYSGF